MMNVGLHVLVKGQQIFAEDPVKPRRAPVPFQDFLGQVLYIAQFIGLAIIAILIVGGCIAVAASHRGGGNSELNYNGKRSVFAGFGLAVIVGAVATILNWAFGFGQTITP